MANFSLTTNSSTTPLQFQGEGTIAASGAFGGGTLQVEASFDEGSTWIALTDGVFTGDATLNIKIGHCWLRTTLTGATSPSLFVAIVGNDVRKSSILA